MAKDASTKKDDWYDAYDPWIKEIYIVSVIIYKLEIREWQKYK